VLSQAGSSTSAPAGDRIKRSSVSPSRAHSLFAGQKNRTLVPMKVGVCTLTEAPQQVQLHGGYTKDTQVRPRTYPSPGRRRNRRCPLWLSFEPSGLCPQIVTFRVITCRPSDGQSTRPHLRHPGRQTEVSGCRHPRSSGPSSGHQMRSSLDIHQFLHRSYSHGYPQALRDYSHACPSERPSAVAPPVLAV